MEVEEAFRGRLMADTAVRDSCGGRVSWVERPQFAALPAIVLQTISAGLPQHLEGFQALRPMRVQVDVWSDRHLPGVQIARVAIAALAGPWTAEGWRFERTMFEGPRSLGETVGSKFIHRQSFDAMLWYAQEN